MQYLIVRCNRARRVLIGGVESGGTDECIELPASGYYTVTLRLDPGEVCTPPSSRVYLVGTDSLNAREVNFDVA